MDEWGGYDDDELLDLDDDDGVMSFPVSVPNQGGRRRSSGRLVSKAASTGFGRMEVPEVVDIVDDDDLDSLPSISSPPRSRTGYDNGAVFDDFGTVQEKRDPDKDRGNVLKDSNSKKGKGTSSSNSRKGTYEDLAAQEVDDFFQETEYSSLADYLAEIEARKQPPQSQTSTGSCSSSIAFNSKSKSGSSSSTATDSQTSQASSSSTKTRKRKSQSPNSSFEEQVKAFEAKNKPKPTATTSYQVNKSGGKKKVKEATSKKPASASSSVTSTQESSDSNIPKRVKTSDFRKMIVLHIPEENLPDEMAAKLIEKELVFEIVERPMSKNFILFEHHATFKMVGKDFQIQNKVVKEMDENILVIFPIEMNLDLLQNEVDMPDTDVGSSSSQSESDSSESLTDWMKNIQRKYPRKKFTLLIQGLEAYLKKVQRATQKEYRDRICQADQAANGKKTKKGKSKQQNNIKLNRNEIQNALIGLQLFTEVNYRFYESKSDLVDMLYNYSKAISDANQKKEREKANQTSFDWYAVADSTGGIPVEMDGKGTMSLWQSQLCQFPSVGQERALAISRVYPSPRALIAAYNRFSTPSEGRNLLTDIQITVGVGPFAKKQKLGPQASKKIYRFFTSTDGEREV